MSQDTFNLNRLFRIFSAGGDETLAVSVYAQLASLVIFRKNTQDNRPVAKFSLDNAARRGIVGYLRELLTAPPNTRLSMVQKKYIREQKSYENSTTFVFFKDDSNMIGIEVSGEHITPPIKFMFKIGNSFDMDKPLTDIEKCELKVKEFIDLLEFKVPVAELLSTYNLPNMPSRNGGQRGGNNNYNNRNSGGGNNNYSRNNDMF